ncbi:MAG: hypothetical protein OER56_12830, partial [Hyphomicrobiales bacterium]|nr:hypothetical protein [Hyphomicrobiales bacterium]
MNILKMLAGGDRRSIGRGAQVVRHVLDDASRFSILIDGLSHGDSLVRMRCADAAEKVSREHPEWLQPFKDELIEIAASSTQQEVRWHLAQMLPRLKLSDRERQSIIALLYDYLDDKSRIVNTFGMTALAELASDDEQLRAKLIPTLKHL